MKNKKIYIYLISLLALSLLGFFLVNFFQNRSDFKISPEIDHLDIAKKIVKNTIPDEELEKLFYNNEKVSKIDVNLIVFLAGYMNMINQNVGKKEFFKAIDESVGLNDKEKIFLKNIIGKKYIPIIEKDLDKK